MSDQIQVTITDNGVGIPATAKRSGLANLVARAQVLGGTCTTTSPMEGGTQLQWRVPLAASEIAAAEA